MSTEDTALGTAQVDPKIQVSLVEARLTRARITAQAEQLVQCGVSALDGVGYKGTEEASPNLERERVLGPEQREEWGSA